MKLRILISATLAAVAVVALFAAPTGGASGFATKYFGWAVIALMSIGAVIEVKEHFAERAARRSEDQDSADRSVGIAILRSEDGDR